MREQYGVEEVERQYIDSLARSLACFAEQHEYKRTLKFERFIVVQLISSFLSSISFLMLRSWSEGVQCDPASS